MKVSVSDSPLLVPLAQSKKLAELRKQSQTIAIPELKKHAHTERTHKDIDGLVTEAQVQIDARINGIMASYPQGKKHKLFTLRYGSPEALKHKAIKAIFAKLQIALPKSFINIENVDYFGIEVQ